jgi:putative tricarboxylic transport membrane protein
MLSESKNQREDSMYCRTIISSAFGLALSLAVGGLATAQTTNVMIPAGPGGGWDTTGRQTIQAMTDAGILSGGANFTNKGGAAGTIGLAEFVNGNQGKDDALIFMGAIMVGGIALNNSPVSLEQTTPIARLTNEYLAIAVAADSPYKTIGDLAEAIKADPGSVAVGGGSAGGVDHILLALIAKEVGADVSKINYIAQASGAETVASVIGGSLAAGISGISEFKSFIDSGRLRILAVSSEERLAGIDAPTLKESGIDVVLGNWRGVLGAPGMSEEAKQKWVANFDKLKESEAWKKTLETQGWEDAYLSGDEFAAFLKEESTRMTGVLKDVGLVQ